MTSSLVNSICKGPKGVISIIGGGGKTSLMFRLAKDLADLGKKVLTTTTTKIFFPEKELSFETIIAVSEENLIQKSKLSRNLHFSAGSRHDPDSGKLEGFSPKTIDQLWQASLFDWIIVEADGSRQKPLKATASHEPVIPGSTTCLILVTGLDAVGVPLDETHVHRALLFSGNTGLPMGKTVGESSIALCLAMELKKAAAFCAAQDHIIFLNKADTQAGTASGIKIINFLKDINQDGRIIIASLKDVSCIKAEITLSKAKHKEIS
ncbi:MAG: hypothetical protein A2277_00995 [Desulfobacterales bacterium RIFOXYA12_FULL_46_15]|nr:MAG: hypothetical protein A2277_00995 [Desulfobacterales bacterium RIFOXYA12_FULL_46_15]